MDFYVKDKLDETGVALKVVNETVNERWEVCLTMSEKGFQQISFVNSIATTKVSKAYNYSFWKLEMFKLLDLQKYDCLNVSLTGLLNRVTLPVNVCLLSLCYPGASFIKLCI